MVKLNKKPVLGVRISNPIAFFKIISLYRSKIAQCVFLKRSRENKTLYNKTGQHISGCWEDEIEEKRLLYTWSLFKHFVSIRINKYDCILHFLCIVVLFQFQYVYWQSKHSSALNVPIFKLRKRTPEITQWILLSIHFGLLHRLHF